MRLKTKILDEIAIKRSLVRITHEIIEKNKGAKDVCLLGVKSRGAPLAVRLKENIKIFEGVDVPVGYIDVTRHRDDISIEEKQCAKDGCEIPCDLSDKTVIIVDDVFYTGRTARAALEAVFTYARPKAIQLAVLIDRGHRELPLKPDYVGKNVPTSGEEEIAVLVNEIDSQEGVFILEK